MAGSPLVGAPGSRFRAINVYETRSRKSVRQHYQELQDHLREAEENGDSEQASRIRAEIDKLEEFTRGALGLGGRSRKSADGLEKIRKAVRIRIWESIEAIQKEHPVLGRHLKNSIRTGKTCSYHPEVPTAWSL